MSAASELGKYPLFLGVETQGWTLIDFQRAAQYARQVGMTSLLVKIADGGNTWYGSIGGWQGVLDAIKATGINAIPYTYCYGNTYGAFQTEINILISAMRSNGIVIADLEVEFNGQPGWAAQLCTALKPVNGIFGVTTWANPNWQQWQQVLPALAPCVDFWLPQVYSDLLASLYKVQYNAYGVTPYYPILNLGVDMGPNNVVQIANEAGFEIIGFWEYSGVNAFASALKQIMKGGTTNVPTTIPPGWTDVNSILTAPNNVQVKTGFRDYVLAHNWDPNNWPLQAEVGMNQLELGNPNLGGGTQQIFRFGGLEWTPKNGVFPMWIGQELLATRAYAIKIAASSQNIQTVTQVKQLAAQLNAAIGNLVTS